MAGTSSLDPLFLAGPTAVGKSSVALELAERMGGEIISVDSMQVYRGLDIGTAKPSAAEQRRIPHHLIDVADLSESFDAARFVQLTTDVVKQIQSRGHVPIFCGGTGLYFKAFTEGLGEAPSASPELRKELEAMPLETLLEELKQRDPTTFERVDRKNPRRVVRALEVIRLTGKPFSSQRAVWSPAPEEVTARSFGLSRPVVDLRNRIDRRVDAMFLQGLVAETEKLMSCGLEKNRTALQALGYRQVVEHLHGEHSLDETIELVKIRTRQFAKRQLTWFRRQMTLKWIEIEKNDAPEIVAKRILNDLNSTIA
mgnify:CR=1 FL=1